MSVGEGNANVTDDDVVSVMVGRDAVVEEYAGIADAMLGVGGAWMSSLSCADVYGEPDNEEPEAADDTDGFTDAVEEGVGVVEGGSDGIVDGAADGVAVDGI